MMDGCADSVRVAIASLVKLIDLLGAERLVGRPYEDVEAFEREVRTKLFAHIEGASAEDVASGVALAHTLVEPVLASLRERMRQGAAIPPFVAPTKPARLH